MKKTLYNFKTLLISKGIDFGEAVIIIIMISVVGAIIDMILSISLDILSLGYYAIISIPMIIPVVVVLILFYSIEV